MANYYGSCRTNYFKVKDEKAFEAAVEALPDIEFHRSDGAIDAKHEGLYCILGNNADGAGWPTHQYNEKLDDYNDFDLVSEVYPHLADGEVAIFMEVGAEKLRFLVGYTEAVNNTGERVEVSLLDIYDKAKQLTDRPEDITQAEY
jgi:hypothetical protein